MTHEPTTVFDFAVRRDDLHQTRIFERPIGPGAAGQVLFRIDRYALTSNNVSYATVGDQLGYWQFFPAEKGWGRIPCFAFADVVRSDHSDIKVGERYFGYFPMSTHLWVDAKPTEGGLIDAAPHRRALPPFYNRYTRVTDDPMYQAEFEDAQMLLGPLFMTSFLLDDFLAEANFFDGKNVLLTSASSKTSIALAHQLRAREEVSLTGLTSSKNRAFVTGLGWYDEVVTYDAIASMNAEVPTVVVDMAGDGAVNHRLHAHFGDRLKHHATVGATHWEHTEHTGDLEGPEPQFFFAPAQVKKRTEDWGPAGLMTRIAQAWMPFVKTTQWWMQVVRISGGEAVMAAYEDLLSGRCPPNEGRVLSLW